MGITIDGTIPHDIVGVSHFVAGNQYQLVGLTNLNTLGLLTPSSTVGNNTIPISDAAGALTWQGIQTFQTLINTSDILPRTSYTYDIGAINQKYLQLHAAELWVETLVAQDTMATIGGRILVAPTTQLTRDLTNVATTIYVKHNNLANGDRVYLEANGQVEFLSIDSGATLEGAGDYSYTVTRNLDASGANAWYAGDAILNTGTTGDGFIDIYSLRGVKAASEAGPTIVGNVRNSATFNDWSEVWAIGNLNGLYSYGVDTYGAAFGKYAANLPWISVDATNGIRIMYGVPGTQLAKWDTSGNILVGQTGGGQGNVYISAGEIDLRVGTTNHVVLSAAGNVTVGQVGVGLSNVYITSGEIELRSNTTVKLLLDTNGYITVGELGVGLRNIYIDGSTLKLRTNLTEELVIDVSGILIGHVGAGESNILLTTGSIALRNNTANMIVLNGGIGTESITIGQVGVTLPNVYITSASLALRVNAVNRIVLDGATSSITVGQTGAGQPNVYITSTAVQLRNGTDVRVSLANDSSGSIGSGGIEWGTTGNLNIAGVLTVGLAGGIYQGTGSFAVPTTGLKLWNDTGVGRIAGYNAGTVQWYADTDGRFYAGAGRVWIDATGYNALMQATYVQASAFNIVDSGGLVRGSYYSVGDTLWHYIHLMARRQAGKQSTLFLTADSPTGQSAEVVMQAWSDVTTTTLSLGVLAAGTRYLNLQADYFSIGLGPATSGIIRLPNDTWIAVLNAASLATVNMWKVNASDLIEAGANLASINVAGSLQCDSVVNDTGLAHGTYTPTLSNAVNVAASTAYTCQYLRVGNTVTVSGVLDVDPTAAGDTQLGISLPVASNIGAVTDCCGVATCQSIAGETAAILGDAANNRATMQWQAVSTANRSMWFTFSYTVI